MLGVVAIESVGVTGGSVIIVSSVIIVISVIEVDIVIGNDTAGVVVSVCAIIGIAIV